MNFERVGPSFCKIINSNNKTEKIIYVESNKDKVHNYFEFYDCKSGEHLELMPKKETRSCLYVTGKSGSGKT
ncbi:MAG: hypothetical protein ACW98X_26510, partial [Promethearchaeota archaeon]